MIRFIKPLECPFILQINTSYNLMFAWFFVFVCASAAEQTMTGEPRSVPVNDTRVLTAAHFAVAEFNKVNAGEMFAYKTVAITSAKIQVVAGIKYILDMLLGQTVCSRSHALNVLICHLFQEYQCHFVVVEVPWEKSRVLSKNECHQNKS
uniref:Cystatin domain-containing protein n=1 Tax=Neolamprologus brichardi TaxID=32507 RepID=A0A3Q4I7J6_NEOBR